jgi:formate dehydrogenase (coenzyme F420) alpha subunit
MSVIVRDGRVVGVQPDAGHPASEGKLCSKGWNAHQFIHHADRLTTPMIRKDGALQPAGWDEAVQFIAEELSRIRGESGSNAIAFLASAKCTNEENYLIQKFARAVVGTNNIDHCARLCHAPTVAGLGAALGSGAMTNSMADLEEAETIFVIGSDTASQHPLIATRIVRAKEKGARLIVADPRKTQLALIADIHLQHRAGTDVALLNGMARVIVDQGLEKRDFIAAKTEGIDAFIALLQNFSLERAAQITGLSAQKIIDAAQAYGQATRGVILYAMGITQHTTGTENVLALANLALLTGNIGRPGTGLNPLRGQNNVQGACDMGALPNFFPGYQPVTDPDAARRLAGAWGVASLPSEIGLTEMEMMQAASRGPIKALYIVGENPALSHPDTQHVRQALKALDLLVVQDIFPTETAEFAHVVLPAACWAEKEGTFTSTERRVQRIRRAVDAPGESRSDWKILCDVARAMGSGRLFDFETAGDVFEELRRIIPACAGMRYETVSRVGGLQWPCPQEGHPGTSILHTDGFPKGRAFFSAIEFRAPGETQDAEYPYLLTTGRVETQWHTGTMTRRSPALNDEAPEPFVEINPEDAQTLGIAESEQVSVRSRRGQITLKALITDRTMPGLVFIPFHFAEAAANVLTNPALDPVAKIPELKVCAVSISASRELHKG